MEHKIGEIFESNGEWYQCVESEQDVCTDCAFNPINSIRYNCSGSCAYKKVIFKKLEKVGEPYYSKYLGKFYQRYKTYIPAVGYNFKIRVEPEHVGGNEIFIEIKQTKEDMEEKNNGNTPLNVLTDKYVNGDICYDDFEKEVKALYSCKEEIKPTLKEFDLEAAKLGKPVCTRDERKARIICFDRVDAKPILALIASTDGKGEDVFDYFVSGKRIANALESDLDLMMLPEKKSGWINIYTNNTVENSRYCGSNIYASKEEALNNISPSLGHYINSSKIEWEE